MNFHLGTVLEKEAMKARESHRDIYRDSSSACIIMNFTNPAFTCGLPLILPAPCPPGATVSLVYSLLPLQLPLVPPLPSGSGHMLAVSLKGDWTGK